MTSRVGQLRAHLNLAMSTSSVAQPLWKSAIDNALKKDKEATVYQLATISSNSTLSLAPHVRTHVHRGFLSPLTPAQPLLLTTTDIRTPKAADIASTPAVAIAWWVAGTQEQFRISGTAHILPSLEAASSGGPGSTIAKKLRDEFPGERLAGKECDWDGKRKEIFDSLSSHMRASWARPVPGTPLPGGYAAAKEWPETLPGLSDVDGGTVTGTVAEQAKGAFRNFALVVVEPTEVDYVELGIIPNQRTKFRREGDGWVKEIVVP
ncbi:hypothetical protein BD410DRAFT_790265 [Rickenella mellea]|uniref:Pyridoxamine 5'-phosphate oxidase Alr4036 family FMN-binding domain-containing protein n=1 Tax=Rickenella mellea TaxID=50990 RepID=A0A4Y7Q0T7_9AGAM|nr:hypothetical protein BD410DRAFT_790265 [Rickenella mellea]